MVTFEVQDMTCGHCVSSITKAVRAIDQSAQVTADLATHRVQIESTGSDKTLLSDAIREAGYTPVPIDDAAILTKQPAPPQRLLLSLSDRFAGALMLISPQGEITPQQDEERKALLDRDADRRHSG